MVHRFKKSSLVLSAAIATLGLAPAYSQTYQAVPGEYLVKFKSGQSSVGLSKVMSKMGEKVALKGTFGHLGVAHLAFKDSAAVEEVRNDSEVEYLEPNYILSKSQDSEAVRGLGTIVESMSREELSAASVQTGLGFTQSGSSTFRTNVQNSWALVAPASTGKVIVAVIDTGVDRTHYIFKTAKSNCNVATDVNFGNQALWVNTDEVAGNGIDDDGNGLIDDVNGFNFISNSGNVIDDDGHGTHVAGIVVGTSVDILNSCNESPIQIMPLKFLDSSGAGTTSNAIRAMYYAVQNGAKVINNSWGGPAYSRSLHDAMAFAYSHDVIVVTAAGNSAQNNDASAMYPANYDTPSNISVAAVENSGPLASFSNYGKAKVSVAAPGVNVFSSIPMSMGGFGLSSGTSMAAPFVAGLAALVVRENPLYNSYDVKNVLIQQSDVVSSLSQKVYSSGVVNIYRALSSADTSSSSMTSKASLPSYTPVYQAERSVASSSEEKSVGGCGLVKTLPPPSGPGGFGMMAVMLVPLVAWMYISMRESSPESRRRFQRFKMSSQVKLQVGDRELVGQVQTISEGGLSFNVDQALEKGGIVQMKVMSPDGQEMIEVQGQIVWCEQSNAYGVQFDQSKESVLSYIRNWSRTLKTTP